MNPLEPSDNELMDGVKRHDGKALEVLYDRYAAMSMGLALKVLRDRASAEEVVVEAFWRVWKSAQTYDPGRGALTTWLFGIVHHLAIDELRRRSVQPSQPKEPEHEKMSEGIADPAPGVADMVWAQLLGEHVRAALQQLPEEQRELIVLAYFEGFTRQEIAQKLGEPLGTIHTRARLALQKLRAILAPDRRED